VVQHEEALAGGLGDIVMIVIVMPMYV